MFGMDDHQEPFLGRVPDGNQPLLGSRRVRIGKGRRQGVVEDTDSLVKRDLVLSAVALRLRSVPFEVHRRLSTARHGSVREHGSSILNGLLDYALSWADYPIGCCRSDVSIHLARCCLQPPPPRSSSSSSYLTEKSFLPSPEFTCCDMF